MQQYLQFPFFSSQKTAQFLIFHLLFALNANAQDVHFSQYDNTPNYTNAALIGLYNGNAYQRAGLVYRNQWASVPVPYNSVALAFDRQIQPKKMKGSSFGLGLLLLHDDAGDSHIGLTELGLQAAYHQAIAKNQWVSLGAQLGAAQRRFQLQKLTFDNQFNGDVFDPQLGSRENVTSYDFLFLDMGVSAGYSWFYDTHTSLEAAISINHLDEPQQSFYNDTKVRLPRRYNLSLRGQFPLADRLDVLLSSQYSLQGKPSEMLFTALFNFTLKEETFKKIAIYGGSGIRLNDAIIPTIGIQYNEWRAGLSFDLNTSAFSTATQSNGGIELTIQHLWYRVPPIKKAKACPVY